MTHYGPDQRAVDQFRAAGFDDTEAYRLAQSGISVADALRQVAFEKIIEDQKKIPGILKGPTSPSTQRITPTPYVPAESFISRLGWLAKWTLILIVLGVLGFYLLPALLGSSHG